ncbi:hypothetical protein FI667_g7073, partial [Globisporangium splendens]
MSSYVPRRALRLACATACTALITFNSAAAADANVCALPATALYFYRVPTANATTDAASNSSNTSSTRVACWSDNVGPTVDVTCLSACSCRQLLRETVGSKSGEFVGVCLNNSINYVCTGNEISNCSAYRLNADGSSTTTPTATTKAPAVSPQATPQASNPPTTGTNTANDGTSDDGLKAWVWAVIVIGIILAVGLIVFAITWFRYRPTYKKGTSSSMQSTVRMDAWRDGHPADLLYGEARDSNPTVSLSVATAATGRMMRAHEANPSMVMSGIPGASYLTYTVGPGINQNQYLNDDDLEHGSSTSKISDGSSSIELYSPAHLQQSDTRGSLTGGAGRLTGGGRYSYPSSGSYNSEIDSFSSQVTFNDSEIGRDTDLQQQQRQQQEAEDEARRYAQPASYPRKYSTEF